MAEKKRMGELLVEAGLIDRDQLKIALSNQRKWGGRLGTNLVRLNFITEEQLLKFLSNYFRLPSVNFKKITISPTVINLLPAEIAHKHNVLVEGEIGYIKGAEDEIVSETELYTQPEEALEFVSKTEVDLFAASVGTNHGVTKGHQVHLRLDLIKEIDDLLISHNLERGIVLHGASGLTAEQQQKAIANGVVKINKDTRYQIEMAAAVQKYWEKEKDAIVKPADIPEEEYFQDKKRFDPRKWMIKAEESIQKAVEDLVQITGSNNKSILL